MNIRDIRSIVVFDENDMDELLDKMNDYHISVIEMNDIDELDFTVDNIYSFCHILIDVYGFYDLSEVIEYIESDNVKVLVSDCVRDVFRDTNIFFVNLQDLKKPPIKKVRFDF